MERVDGGPSPDQWSLSGAGILGWDSTTLLRVAICI